MVGRGIEQDKLVWSNGLGMCEIWLTPEGAYYLGAEVPVMVEPPQAVRIEFGLGGCVDGATHLLALPLKEARARLGLPDGGTVEVREGEEDGVRGRLRAWTELHGWHALQRRLLERGRDDREVHPTSPSSQQPWPVVGCRNSVSSGRRRRGGRRGGGAVELWPRGGEGQGSYSRLFRGRERGGDVCERESVCVRER